MGLAIARKFATHGFAVALIARNEQSLNKLVQELADEGVRAEALTADVLDRPSIVATLLAVSERLGPIDVLEFSPANPSLPMASPTEVSVENVQSQIDFYVHGGITAVQHVQVGHIAINAWLGNQPGAEPELVAPLYWNLHLNRDTSELVFSPESEASVQEH